MNYEREVAEANYPFIRLLQVKKTVSLTPQDNVEMNGGVGRNVALTLFRSFHLSLISMPANCGKN